MSVRAEIEGVSVRLGKVQALDAINLIVEPGQFLALLGPSGSGKTTTLNVLGGFVHPDRGVVKFDGRDVTNVRPYKRELGIVFQGYALFPQMTVGENVAFPLRMRKVPRRERIEKARQALELVGLNEHIDRVVSTLSGGQRQRVALARAIVFEPRLMLLDEPLAALDKQRREAMQIELRRLQNRVGITTVAVTHDQVEALSMADIVAVMRDGRIEQVGAPEDLYLRPANLFVARFLGEANLLPVERGELRGFGAIGTAGSGQAVVRPEHLSVRVGQMDVTDKTIARAVIREITFQGERLRIHARLASDLGVELVITERVSVLTNALAAGDEVEVVLDPALLHVVKENKAEDIGTFPQPEVSSAAGVLAR
jgi:putative spermidine/putrescine transport system ATP-binding protein